MKSSQPELVLNVHDGVRLKPVYLSLSHKFLQIRLYLELGLLLHFGINLSTASSFPLSFT